ncbi:exopolysaccharide biosynthesis polyprenyl glycosylphosphotransferase [Parageobacillus toebii]|uniref:exopolysaccharide biosynthesis polyprenyl glycosylphosphotransferase n=1 Tax=Parageobacillus toebii TaxID=153151 RepID=UPI001966FF0E|nr:exopolysaccharide biosynthesis polyprenyl glycosylphosphotransferase [Parageobacillus toebii]QSB49335.1 exopolysaccharide biosynthesis polyprenyl glycosylphosphotransferase [Parageobacillus toebii]
MGVSSSKKNDFFREYAVAIDTQYTIRNQKANIKYYPYVKRFLDILLSLLALPIAIPIILIFAVIIKLETPGPVFFLQERVGLHGKYFKVIKLRSMGVDAEKNGAQWATKNDPRVTKVGAFIRKTRIDELPQLFNVLKGDMSLIGPRPERPMFTAQFNEEIPGFIDRLQVKPGITGWAQVNGGYDITPREKLELDRYYINNMSFWLDLKILLKTIKVCITGDGAR